MGPHHAGPRDRLRAASAPVGWRPRARAAHLSAAYLGGRAQPASVRWVSNQESRWGSCTPAEGSIRISDKVRGMPGWVLDYVLLHELAHLIEPGHGLPSGRC